MTPFLTRLRALDAAASGAPWEWEWNFDGYPTELVAAGVGVIRPGIAVSPTDGTLSAFLTNDGDSAGRDHADFALIVALRNAAPRIAALVEAAADVVLPERCGLGDVTEGAVLTDVEAAHLRRLAAELAALDKEGAS